MEADVAATDLGVTGAAAMATAAALGWVGGVEEGVGSAMAAVVPKGATVEMVAVEVEAAVAGEICIRLNQYRLELHRL